MIFSLDCTFLWWGCGSSRLSRECFCEDFFFFFLVVGQRLLTNQMFVWWHLSLVCAQYCASYRKSLAYLSYFTESPTFVFLVVPHSFITWETRNSEKLKNLIEWLSDVHNNQCVLVFFWTHLKKSVFKGGVEYYWFCNSITCWAVGTQILDLQFCVV